MKSIGRLLNTVTDVPDWVGPRIEADSISTDPAQGDLDRDVLYSFLGDSSSTGDDRTITSADTYILF